ncbi:TlpA family protein disulfide reductase [Haloferula sargassicola]|uniref:Thioredoxin domain-containing protein n=1 Tax=Haloferula sargassicola TaxID=490096 RepID=A0ABP9UK19_9BACT
MMRAAGIALLLALAPLARAEEPAAGMSLREAVDLMLSERESKQALDKAIDRARQLGASDQSVLEARFLYSVDRREDEMIAGLAPEFQARRDSFKLADSEIFGVREDWLAVVEYAQAIACLEKDDTAGFKQHITEAFWLSPKQGAAFAPHIERLRLQEAMRNLHLDFSISLETLDGGSTTLHEVVGDRKALLIHFFSPWSRECEESLGDFAKLASSLEKAGIAVMSIVGESDEETRTDTLAMLESLGKRPAGPWVLDRKKRPLAPLLRIQSAPTMVLVDLDGSILFNGHPSEDELWSAIQKIVPGFKRPAGAPSH